MNDRILIIMLNKEITDTKDDGCLYLGVKYCNNIDEVSNYLNVPKTKIKKAIEFNGQYENYKSNIVKKKINDDTAEKYIVVYESDWNSYSRAKRENRINKLISEYGMCLNIVDTDNTDITN